MTQTIPAPDYPGPGNPQIPLLTNPGRWDILTKL